MNNIFIIGEIVLIILLTLLILMLCKVSYSIKTISTSRKEFRILINHFNQSIKNAHSNILDFKIIAEEATRKLSRQIIQVKEHEDKISLLMNNTERLYEKITNKEQNIQDFNNETTNYNVINKNFKNMR